VVTEGALLLAGSRCSWRFIASVSASCRSPRSSTASRITRNTADTRPHTHRPASLQTPRTGLPSTHRPPSLHTPACRHGRRTKI